MQSTVCSGLSLCKRERHINVGLYFQSSGSITQNLIKLLSLWGARFGEARRREAELFVKLLCYMVLTLELCKCFIYKVEFKKNKNKYL